MCIRDRDIGKQIDFGVSYDAATESVRIDTDAPYTESTTPAGGSAITKWNKTMSEFNQAMIDCNWRPEKYLETAKKYAPVITGKAEDVYKRQALYGFRLLQTKRSQPPTVPSAPATGTVEWVAGMRHMIRRAGISESVRRVQPTLLSRYI